MDMQAHDRRSGAHRRNSLISAYWTPLTLRLLQDAGLAPGMHVLDVGCGIGDVSLIASELVGSSGSVLGVDRAPEVLQTARARALAGGYPEVHFVKADAGTYQPAEPFDAIIGRLVLIHQAHPVDVVRH